MFTGMVEKNGWPQYVQKDCELTLLPSNGIYGIPYTPGPLAICLKCYRQADWHNCYKTEKDNTLIEYAVIRKCQMRNLIIT